MVGVIDPSIRRINDTNKANQANSEANEANSEVNEAKATCM